MITYVNTVIFTDDNLVLGCVKKGGLSPSEIMIKKQTKTAHPL